MICVRTQTQAEAKAAEEAAKAVAASVRYDKDRVKDMFKLSKVLDPKSKEYQKVCISLQLERFFQSEIYV